MPSTLLEQGVTLMLVGMGTVFVFLTILVAGTTLMAFIIRRLLPEPVDPVASDEEIAVITAAIDRHRKSHP